MRKEEVLFLSQLINSIEEHVERLERFYKKKDYQNFNKCKKTIMGIQQEISNALT